MCIRSESAQNKHSVLAGVTRSLSLPKPSGLSWAALPPAWLPHWWKAGAPLTFASKPARKPVTLSPTPPVKRRGVYKTLLLIFFFRENKKKYIRGRFWSQKSYFFSQKKRLNGWKCWWVIRFNHLEHACTVWAILSQAAHKHKEERSRDGGGAARTSYRGKVKISLSLCQQTTHKKGEKTWGSLDTEMVGTWVAGEGFLDVGRVVCLCPQAPLQRYDRMSSSPSEIRTPLGMFQRTKIFLQVFFWLSQNSLVEITKTKQSFCCYSLFVLPS